MPTQGLLNLLRCQADVPQDNRHVRLPELRRAYKIAQHVEINRASGCHNDNIIHLSSIRNVHIMKPPPEGLVIDMAAGISPRAEHVAVTQGK